MSVLDCQFGMELSKSKPGSGGGVDTLENDLLELLLVSCAWWTVRHNAGVFLEELGGARKTQTAPVRKQRELPGNPTLPLAQPSFPGLR